MASYTKLWSQILDSTVWQQPNDFRVLWITLLAKKDKDHIVRASIPGLATAANITPELCVKYLEKLMSPEKWSSTEAHEGRRLAKVDGGWLVLNGEKYQNLLREEHRKEAVAKSMRDMRARKRTDTLGNGPSVADKVPVTTRRGKALVAGQVIEP